MGGVFKPDPPPPPDYAAMAKQQGEDNKDAAIYNSQINRADQITPYGNLTWAQGEAGADGSPGRWTQTVSLSPEQQKLQDMQNQSSLSYGQASLDGLSNAMGALSQPMDTSGLGQRVTGVSPSSTPFTPQALERVSADKLQQMYSGGPAGVASAGSAGSGGNIATTFDQSGVRKLPGTIDDTSRRRVEEALMSRLNPQLARDESALRTRLLNSGIEVGTNAYNRELTNFGQNVNDARMQAVLAGGGEESRQVGLQQGLQGQEYAQALSTGNFRQTGESQMAGNATQAGIANAQMATQASLANAAAKNNFQQNGANAYLASLGINNNAIASENAAKSAAGNQQFNQQLAAAQFANSARQQGLEEQTFLRSQPLNELNALRSGSQVSAPTFSNYYTGGNAAAAPTMEAGLAQGAYSQNAYNQQVAGSNALMGGLASLGGAAMMAPVGTFSDRRLKKNLANIGQHPSGVPRYVWDWKDGSGSDYGVMAQDLFAVRPDAVVDMGNGLLGVNYSMIGGR